MSIKKQKRILVYLANGNRGRMIAQEAMRRGYSVRLLVRDSARCADLQKAGAELALADLNNAEELAIAHEGIDYAIVQIPASNAETTARLAHNAATALKAHRPRGIILTTGNGKPSVTAGVTAFQVQQMIEDTIQAADIPLTTVRPTMYLDNFLVEPIRTKISEVSTIVYPIAENQKVAWTSAENAARLCLAVIDSEAFGVDFQSAGNKAITGAELAAAFSEALGRSIRFKSFAIDAFENVAGKWVAEKFRFFEKYPHEADRMLAIPFNATTAPNTALPDGIGDWLKQNRRSFGADE